MPGSEILIGSSLQVNKIDINRSLSSLTTTAGVSLDDILRRCGDLGRFQWTHFFFINLIGMSAGIVSFYYVFAAATPDHRCRLPDEIWPNDTLYSPVNRVHDELVARYVATAPQRNKWNTCTYYPSGNRNETAVECPYGWVYDRSTFGYTFTEEANFVCERESRKSWLATLMQCGGFSLLIIGSLADRYGRKRLAVLVTLLLFSTCLLTQILMQWTPMTVQTKFILLLVNQFASGLAASTYSVLFILMLELTSASHTSFAANLAFISFTIGEVLVALAAYVTRDWQQLKWTNTAFIGLGIPYLYFMPESPLYVYSKRQYVQLETILRRIATTNGRKESDWLAAYQELVHHRPASLLARNERRLADQLLTHRSSVAKLSVISLIGFTTLLLYIKISYSLAVMPVSPYLAILIGALVEAASYVSSALLISTRLGRKGSFTILMSLTILCILLIPITVKRSALGSVLIAQLGKYAISGATAISWIFVPELFPTSIRGTANGLFIASSRLGAMISPIISASVSDDYLPYTFYTSAVLAFVVLVVSCVLPETKDKPMDDELRI